MRVIGTVRRHLGSIRGQLILAYLSILAILLVALVVVQTLTLTQYLRSSTADSVRHAAFAELHVLDPCFIRTPAQLSSRAQSLAQLLGTRSTAVKIVNSSGQVLADHGFGPPGASHPLVLTGATIQRLIRSLTPHGGNATTTPSSCSPHPSHPGGGAIHHAPFDQNTMITQGNILLLALPLGDYGHPAGYAVLGRSLSGAANTVRRAEVVSIIGVIVALLIAAAVALPLINRALRPLRRVAQTSAAIAGGDVGQRANLDHTPDEIGRLGSAFDAMVDQLEGALSGARESEERMRRFLADASHELRTPLTVLRGMSEVVLRQDRGEHAELTAALRAMNEEAVRASRLVDDLLVLSRLDAGSELTAENVPISHFLQEFLHRYGSAWPERPITLAVDSLNGATARVDPEALRRILTNLVDNAARYSRPGGSIAVRGSAARDRVAVVVSDEGPGLTPEDAAHVFERFYRGAKARSRRSGGTGLGLSIVYGLVEMSGGKVEINTGVEQGTTVTVTLPRSADSR